MSAVATFLTGVCLGASAGILIVNELWHRFTTRAISEMGAGWQESINALSAGWQQTIDEYGAQLDPLCGDGAMLHAARDAVTYQQGREDAAEWYEWQARDMERRRIIEAIKATRPAVSAALREHSFGSDGVPDDEADCCADIALGIILAALQPNETHHAEDCPWPADACQCQGVFPINPNEGERA